MTITKKFLAVVLSFSLLFSPDAVSAAESASGVVPVESGIPVLDDDEAPQNLLQEMNIRKERLTIVEGQSHVLKFAQKVHRISVSNPDVLDFLTVSPDEILLNAKTYGSVNLIVWNFLGQVTSFDINVIRDAGVLDQLLKKIDPTGQFEIFPSRDVFVVRGETSSVRNMNLIKEAVENFARGSVSLVRVKNVKQVLLQTRFVKIDHSRDYDFGLALEHDSDHGPESSILQRFLPGSNGSNAHGTTAATGSATRTFGTPALTHAVFDRNDVDLYQLVYSSANTNMRMFMKALELNQIGKTIARPNLLAKDGEEASFVVGGETPVIIGTNDQVSVQYKPFGTRLTFKPEIMEDETIQLTIEPEVSTQNTTRITVGSSSSIPEFTTTKVKTVVQLQNGETLLLGGLLEQKLEKTERGVPLFRRIPVFGKLFENTDYNWTEKELLVIVTPKIMNPEKEPISHKNERDVLNKATEFMESPALPADPQSRAVHLYLGEQKRWGEVDQLEEELKGITLKGAPEKPAGGKTSPVSVVPVTVRSRMKHQWKSKKTGEAAPVPGSAGGLPSPAWTISERDKAMEQEIALQRIRA